MHLLTAQIVIATSLGKCCYQGARSNSEDTFQKNIKGPLLIN